MSATSSGRRRAAALLLLAAAQFMVIMDTSIIGVALPEIRDALGFSQSDLSWVFNAYVVAFGGLLLLGGRLSDLLGARRVFTAGWVVLLAGSLMAGLATTVELEIAGRAVQGLGAALIAPAGLALLFTIFSGSPRELGRALAVYGAAAPAGGTAGVFLGGVLTEWLDWRWTFLINLPVAVAALALVPVLLPQVAARRGRVDLVGAGAVTGALTLTVLGIVRANQVGWTSLQTLAVLGAAAALLIAFITSQALRRDPLMPLGIFRTHNLSAANLTMALLGAAWIPMWFFLNLYLQQVKGYGAFEGGAALLPMTLAIMLLMVAVTGRIAERIGAKATAVTGLGILAVGIGLLALAPAEGSYALHVLPGSLVAAIGMSLAYIPVLTSALAGVRPQDGGLASGIVNTTYQVGSAIGLAAMSAVASAAGADRIGNVLSLADGFQAAFAGAAGIAALGAIAALVFLRGQRQAPPSATPATQEQHPAPDPVTAAV
jgi:EmrB/QacA subfamily drug resistance transporter